MIKYDVSEIRQFRKDNFSEFVLAGDISGTNTSISIAGVRDNKPEPLFVLRFKSQELPIITDAINETLKFKLVELPHL